MFSFFLNFSEYVPSIWAPEGLDYDPETMNTKVFPSPLSTVYTVKNGQINEQKDDMKKGIFPHPYM